MTSTGPLAQWNLVCQQGRTKWINLVIGNIEEDWYDATWRLRISERGAEGSFYDSEDFVWNDSDGLDRTLTITDAETLAFPAGPVVFQLDLISDELGIYDPPLYFANGQVTATAPEASA